MSTPGYEKAKQALGDFADELRGMGYDKDGIILELLSVSGQVIRKVREDPAYD